MPVMCKMCNKVYSTQFNLNKHCRNTHNVKSQSYSYSEHLYKFKCLDCLWSFPKSVNLTEHLKNEHGKDISEERVEFQSLKEFYFWKYEIEQEELCNYVVLSGRKSLHSGEEVKYFVCNRSGNINNRIEDVKEIINRKRNTKTQGSAKLNYCCISKITLKKKENKYVAYRIISHYGHSTEIQHLRISHLDRQELASKLVEGVSRKRILDDTRNKITTDLKRIDLLTRQDLDNLKRSYNIQFNEGVKHKDDATSVELWVQECETLEVNPVLLYKPQGQSSQMLENCDFCLIIMNDVQELLLKQLGQNIIAIDSTHGLNNYDFELTTLMVV